MRNVTKLSIWPQLQALGFVPIRYRFNGKIVAVGAALQKEHIGTDNRPFKSDVICIEPHNFQYDKRAYHITGQIKTPFYETGFRYDAIGRKEQLTLLKDHINEHFAATDILSTVKLMLK